jgi:hypothetical protein
MKTKGLYIFLLRDLSRGKGVGFFEAGNFHPDFILWILSEDKLRAQFKELYRARGKRYIPNKVHNFAGLWEFR